MAKKEAQNSVIIKNKYRGGGSGMVYGLGLIGSLIYFLSHTTTFWDGVIAILKSLVWPAFLVYGLLGFLKM